MNLFSRAKRLAGDILFRCQNARGQYRVKVFERKPLAVLMYHGLETDPRRQTSGFHWATPESSLREIHFFQQQGYRLVSAKDLDSLADSREESVAGYLLVSFDDGHANIFPHLMRWFEVEKIPALIGICPGIVEENGIYWWEETRARFGLMEQDTITIRSSDGAPMHFAKADSQKFEETGRSVLHQELQFLLAQLREQTSYIDERQLKESIYIHENMNWQQITELARHPLCTLASHSMYHEIATQQSAEDLRRRTQASLDALEVKTGCRIRHYIYPNGGLSAETDKVLASLGIHHTYSVTSALNPIPVGMRLNRFRGYESDRRGWWNYGRRWRKLHSGLI